MSTFTIGEKEYELKIDYKGVKYLNAVYSGGSYEIIGKAMMGDLDTFPYIIHAALKHTGENISLNKVEEAISAAIEQEKLDLDDIIKLSNEVVTQSFFYKKTVEKLLKDNPEAKAALAQLLV